MTPLYFGAGRQRLFGIYEPAVLTGRRSKRGAVLCSPWGPEYVHAHRVMRQLAIRLAGAGIDTLRFDFFGTGDSAGEMVDADLGTWEADIELAMDELRDIVASPRLTLIGLRLGATLAARVAARHPGDVDALVLWDPILSGPGYLASLGAAAAPAPSGPPLTVRGFPMTSELHRDLLAIALAPPFTRPGTRGLTLITDPGAQASPPAPWDGQPGRSDTVEFIEAVRPWIEDPDNMGAVPVGVLQRIVDWLG
jgi:pimeloyl-ACP methyl ester carboxylesterase